MLSNIEADNIICGSCGLSFERSAEYRHCSNCVVCTGCEIYYCPGCDGEVVVIPLRYKKEGDAETPSSLILSG